PGAQVVGGDAGGVVGDVQWLEVVGVHSGIDVVGVDLPDLESRAGQRVAGGGAHGSGHDQRFAGFVGAHRQDGGAGEDGGAGAVGGAFHLPMARAVLLRVGVGRALGSFEDGL